VAKLSPVSWTDLVSRLRALGFEGPYQEGKHPYMVRAHMVLPIPNPHRREISIDLLSRILRRAEITREDWLKHDR